jgi:prepilin-type processing-associated H-X9-DG protein
MASALAAGIAGGRSYVMTQKSGAANGFIDLSASPTSPTSRLLVEATIPGATILLTESWSSNNGTLTGNSTQGYFSTSAITGYTTTASIPQLSGVSGSYYHGSAINYLMVDGRIQALNPKLVAVANPTAATDPHWKVIR